MERDDIDMLIERVVVLYPLAKAFYFGFKEVLFNKYPTKSFPGL